jgi:hypothetical protein
MKLLEKFIGAAAVLAIAVAAAAPALASDAEFVLANDGQSRVVGAFVRPAGTPKWGRNLLGEYAIPPGHYFRIDPKHGVSAREPASSTRSVRCWYDLRVDLENGKRHVLPGLNACEATEVVVRPGGISVKATDGILIPATF